jgi:hypothetical protein
MMTGWLLLSTIIVGAITGGLTALLVDAMRAESRRYDAGMDRIAAELAAERGQRHQVGGHVRRGGHGPCAICGDRGEQ